MSDNIEFINEQSLDVKIAPTATDYVRILDASDSNKSKLALISELPSTSSSGGDLVSTNNLSDVANAATAFGNIKQAATESATGVVELATTSEATTGTDTTRAVTPAGVKAVADTKANSSHSHKQSDITNLTTDLAEKQATITGAATTIASSNLTASRAVVSDASGKVAAATTTATEIGYVNGVTSAIQTQLNAKSPIESPTFTGTATTPALNISGQTASRIAILDGSKNLISANTSTYPSLAELEYVKGVTSAIQTQVDSVRTTSTQNSQSTAYTLVLGDAGKTILHPSADTTARIFTVPANSSVAYPVGTCITIVNQNAAGVVTVAITTDTMRLAGAGTTGARTLAANGVATLIKLTSTEWIISGVGLT